MAKFMRCIKAILRLTVTSNEYPTSLKKVKLSSNLTSHLKEVEERQNPKFCQKEGNYKEAIKEIETKKPKEKFSKMKS